MRILKFGGTSIKTTTRINNALEIIQKALDESEIAIVVSAFGGVTDLLSAMAVKSVNDDPGYRDDLQKFTRIHVEMAQALIEGESQSEVLDTVDKYVSRLSDILYGVSLVKDLAPKSLNQILSYGERLSARIICAGLKRKGIEAEYLDARKVIKTNSNYGSARVDFDITNAKIKCYFDQHHKTQIVTGFIASNSEGETTVLGRSGSDYTASIIGAALGASEIEIWTDVNGVMTANPNIENQAKSIPEMSYADAMEMSHFGAKVIYPPTILPVMTLGIPIRIKNSFNLKFAGTVIGNQNVNSDSRITGISSIEKMSLIRIQGSGMIGKVGFIGRVFQSIGARDVGVMLISVASSEQSICFAVKPEDARAAKEAIEDEFQLEIQLNSIAKILIEDDLSIVAVVGENMRHTPGISGKVFSALGQHAVNVVAIAQGSSERNISIVINQKDESTAIRALHQAFFGSEA